MEQNIAGSSSVIIPNKVSNPVEQPKAINNEADGENADLNRVVPFLQLLNQQITLLNPTDEPVAELANELGEEIPRQKNINAGDHLLGKDENKNALLKQNQILTMAKELSEMKGILPDLEGIGKNTLFKSEDTKNIEDMLSDQMIKSNGLKILDNQSMISNASKLPAGNIADKSGLASIEVLQTISSNMAGNIKNELKENIIIGDKNTLDISSNYVNTANNGMVKVSSIDDISSGQIIDRVVSGIKENVSADGGRIKITLSPPSLGTLEMDVAVRNNKVEVIIIADNKDVQQTLNAHLDRLKGSLLNHGLTIDRCEVLMQNNREGYQQNYSQQAFYRDGSEKSINNSKEKYNEELKPIMPIQPQITNSPSFDPDNISIFA